MNIISKKSEIINTFKVATDKSISHRSLILGALATEPSFIENILWGEDVQSTASILRNLGCDLEISDIDIDNATANISIDPSNFLQNKPTNHVLNCGNSGTTMRLMTGLLCCSNYPFSLVGDISLTNRPMRRVVDPLQHLGFGYECNGKNYRPPILFEPSRSSNTIICFEYHLPIASAQVKSALLLCGLQNNGCRLTGGKNSRNHTEIMLEYMGVDIQYPKNSLLNINKTNELSDAIVLRNSSPLKGFNCSIPVDQSSAAFVITAALICPNSSIVIENINMNPTRTGFLEHVIKMGAHIEVEDISNDKYIEPVARLTIHYSPDLFNVDIHSEDLPRLIDEVPILTLLATQAKGPFHLSDASELRVKETDRIAMTVRNLRAIGVVISEFEDGLSLVGRQEIIGGEVNCYHDHRIAMMSVISGLISNEGVLVKDIECIETSFPNFFSELQRCGANISVG